MFPEAPAQRWSEPSYCLSCRSRFGLGPALRAGRACALLADERPGLLDDNLGHIPGEVSGAESVSVHRRLPIGRGGVAVARAPWSGVSTIITAAADMDREMIDDGPRVAALERVTHCTIRASPAGARAPDAHGRSAARQLSMGRYAGSRSARQINCIHAGPSPSRSRLADARSSHRSCSCRSPPSGSR